MKNTKELIATLRAKPEHVRQRIAIGASGAVTGLVALVWVVALAANGTFSLQSSSALAVQQNEPQPLAATSQPNSFTQLLGAAAAAGSSSSAPSLTIVDDGTKSTLSNKTVPSEATVIPF
jgi:hypothetical protein